jgi:hypothetical protein
MWVVKLCGSDGRLSLACAASSMLAQMCVSYRDLQIEHDSALRYLRPVHQGIAVEVVQLLYSIKRSPCTLREGRAELDMMMKTDQQDQRDPKHERCCV